MQRQSIGDSASQSSGTKDAANLPASHATTQVVVHYTVPEGQRYLPITLNHMVTMIFIGKHGEDFVYEPINNWLQSPEEGLRYHRTMDVNDVYDGCLDMATFGRPVVGPISQDHKWLVNPLVYDPTRPPPLQYQTGEILEDRTKVWRLPPTSRARSEITPVTPQPQTLKSA